MPGEARRRRIRALLRAVDIDLDPIAVEPAFVHESAAREGAGPSNERLELLGDAILGFVTVRWLFERYPNANEGELARRKHALVSGDACALTAKRLGFGDLLLLGHGAASSGGAENSSILADSFEAFIAAVVRASDLSVGAAFIEREHLAHVERDEQAFADAKTALQEYTQGRYGFAPTYYERYEALHLRCKDRRGSDGRGHRVLEESRSDKCCGLGSCQAADARRRSAAAPGPRSPK
jgi:ribonuclease-3